MHKKIISALMSAALLFASAAVLPTNVVSTDTAISASADGSFYTGKKLQLDMPYTDALDPNEYNNGSHYPNPTNYYYFDLPSAGKINLSFGREYTDVGAGWTVVIYNEELDDVLTQDFAKETARTETTCSIGLPKGRGYIEVRKNGDYWDDVSPANYTLKVNYTQSSYWESEINNSMDSATPAKLGSVYYGATAYTLDADYFKINIPKTGYYNFSFGRAYSDEEHGWDVKIYNRNQDDVFSQTFENKTSRTDTVKIKLSAGMNYIKVCRANDETIYKAGVTTSDYHFRLAYSVAGAKISGVKSSYVYTGKAITPTVTVKYGSTTLKKGTDYTVSYKNNKSAGVATIVIKGKGSYSGTIKKTFKIAPTKEKITGIRSPKAAQIRVAWSKNSQATGYQILYSSKSSFSSYCKVTVSKSYTAKTITKNIVKGRKYYVKVRAYKKSGNTYVFGKWSDVKSVTAKK